MLKKILAGITLVVCIITAGGIYFIQTEYAGIGLPWVKSVDLPEIHPLGQTVSTLDATSEGLIYFASRSPYSMHNALFNYENSAATTGMGELFLPAIASSDRPVPAMVILHGSGGKRDDREYMYAKWFNERGIAAFVIDYYAPRGVTPSTKYLYKTLSASDIDIVADAFSALNLLSTHPAIDANRIGVTGYSYGGMATRYTLDPRLKQSIAPTSPNFALHVSFYGPCFQTTGSELTTGAPYLAVYGDQDNSVEPAFCDELHQRLREGGSEVDTLLIAGAGHAWENEQARQEYDFPYVRGCEFSYSKDKAYPTIDGKEIDFPGADASRGELAFNRVSVHLTAPECVGNGYIIGRDEKSDELAKAKMWSFLQKHFDL